MESRRKAAITMDASSRTETSVPSLKEMRVEPTETCRAWVTASTLMYVEASSAFKWSTTHFATSGSLATHRDASGYVHDTKPSLLRQGNPDGGVTVVTVLHARGYPLPLSALSNRRALWRKPDWVKDEPSDRDRRTRRGHVVAADRASTSRRSEET